MNILVISAAIFTNLIADTVTKMHGKEITGREIKEENIYLMEQDPMGTSWDRPLPSIFSFSSSLKYVKNSLKHIS